MLNFDFPFDDDLEEDVKFYGMFDDSESSGHNAISVEALTKQIKELFNVSFGKIVFNPFNVFTPFMNVNA